MICFPNAKINLGLSVISSRSDGMHNIETCIIPVPLFDILEIRKSSSFSIITDGIKIDGAQEENLITKAWRIISSLYDNITPVKVYLYKNIPIGSGLGGGSADAAFFLRMIRTLFSLKIPDMELESIATSVGADCPFFIKNQPALATGIGNIFKSVSNPISGKYLTIVYPGFSSNTKDAYSSIVPKKSYDLPEVLKMDIHLWRNLLSNDFENKLMIEFPRIKRLKEELYNFGADYVSLTGSGSALFAVSTEPIITTDGHYDFSHWCFCID